MERLRGMVRDINALLREYMRKSWIALDGAVTGDPWNLIEVETAFANDFAALVGLRDQMERIPYVGVYIRPFEGVKTPQLYLPEADEELAEDTCNRTHLMVALERFATYLHRVSE